MPDNPDIHDLVIIGGGINGCGIARDAAGRGLKVLLAEQGDLAGATSSASTKLIHGGLRYLEHYEFRLVREALIEREVLLQAAPHIIRPLRFVLPHHRGLRPWPVLRLGLFLYDHLGGRKILPATRSVDLRHDVTGEPLKPEFTRAFEYSDCWVEDARLVVLNAIGARERGADIRTRTRCVAAHRQDGLWRCTLDRAGERTTVSARMLINTGGPWVSEVLGNVIGMNDPDKIRMVKGSHIVVDKLYDHDRCYIFQNKDGRICFAIPYEQNFTLIGTTDQDHHGDPAKPKISVDERDYLLAAVSDYFKRPVTAEMVRWSYAGIRPLYDDGASKAQEATREYVLKLDAPDGQPPLLSVFGGKITTFRKLAEAALEKVAPFFPQMGKPWTAEAAFAGGDFPYADVEARIADFGRRYAFLNPQNARRIFRSYGTRADRVLGGAKNANDLGRSFGSLSEREIDYLRREEWAETPEDILWRRSKLGLHLAEAEQNALRSHMESNAASPQRDKTVRVAQ
ncbi:MAG: glycerol-3-phosphate dehydrogenase [Parvibaculaceae bacterium]